MEIPGCGAVFFAPRLASAGLVTVSARYRQIVDPGNLDRSVVVLSSGESGQPTNRWLSEHDGTLARGEYHPMLWSKDRVLMAPASNAESGSMSHVRGWRNTVRNGTSQLGTARTLPRPMVDWIMLLQGYFVAS